jgi:hypothetical protein
VWKITHLSVGELNPQASAMHRLVSLGMGWLEQGCHLSWSSVVSWEAGSWWKKVLRFWRVILHGEARSGMHSYSREACLTGLWCIQGAITATLTVLEVVDKVTTKVPLQLGFNAWTFYLFIYFFLDSILFF